MMVDFGTRVEGILEHMNYFYFCDLHLFPLAAEYLDSMELFEDIQIASAMHQNERYKIYENQKRHLHYTYSICIEKKSNCDITDVVAIHVSRPSISQVYWVISFHIEIFCL